MDEMLKRLNTERDERITFMRSLTDAAVEQNRDLSDNDRELIKTAKERVLKINEQIDTLSGDIELNDQAKARLAVVGRGALGLSGTGTDEIKYRSAGHYLSDYLNAIVGVGDKKAQAEDRLKRFNRAAAHVTTDLFAGVFPDTIVGPVLSFINTSRPLAAALGMRSVPNGPTFRRPRLVDDHIADGVGPQAAQKNELVSQPFSLVSDNVDLTTLGGYVNVARQVLDWGVASMETIVNQLAARYAYATERALIAEISLSTGKETLAAGADSASVIAAFYNAAGKLYEATNQLPTILAAGPLGWARLGSLVDAAGRQVFPFLAPSNASGQMSADSFQANPVGLRLVVTPGITDDTYWVLNDLAIEGYEQTIGSLSVSEPSVLGIQVAYAGYTGFYRPSPNAAIHIAP